MMSDDDPWNTILTSQVIDASLRKNLIINVSTTLKAI